MKIVMNPATSISGELTAPPSKLYTQVSSAVAILANGKSTIDSPLRVRDTNVILRAAEYFGATVKRTQERWSIWGTGGEIKSDKSSIDAKNSGTVMSILASISTISHTPIVLNGDAQLRSRPMPTLLKALRSLGAEIYSTKPDDSPPFMIFGGGLTGGRARLGNMKSRYLPAILIASPYAKKKVDLVFRGKKIKQVAKIMKAARVNVVEKRGGLISVPKQKYRSFNYRVPTEITGAAPFIAAAALTNSGLKISNIGDITQRDEEFLRYIKSFGLSAHTKRKSLSIEGGRLKAAKLNLSPAPELLPVLAVLACAAKGRTILHGAADARSMKSDRISAVTNELRRMKARVLERNDGLIINGPSKLKGCEIYGHNDYAITSSLIAAAFIADSKTTIKNDLDPLGFNYVRFVSNFRNLGAEIGYGH